MENPSEILLIDKPAGITSFDVIRRLRNRLNVKKIGHAGTLDPLATGLMILGVGPGTKQLTNYIKLDKVYEAEIRVGERRTTGDLEGDVTDSKSVEQSFTDEQLEKILDGMVGTTILPVSAYSAIKKNGVPMYKRAREAEKKGEEVTEIPMRAMEIFKAELVSQKTQPVKALDDNIVNCTKLENDCSSRLIVKVRFHVGSGTYIRSLAEEFGKQLGYPATLQSLRRTRVGQFDIKNAQILEDYKL